MVGLIAGPLISLFFQKESLFWQEVVTSLKFHLYHECKMWFYFFCNPHTSMVFYPNLHFPLQKSYSFPLPILFFSPEYFRSNRDMSSLFCCCCRKYCSKGRPWVYFGGMVCKWEILFKDAFLDESICVVLILNKWCQGGVFFSSKHLWSQCTNNIYIPVHREKRNVKIFHWKLTALTNFKG